ncbi:MAG: methyltransferase domain-containing protein [Planctomycetota bacterium]
MRSPEERRELEQRVQEVSSWYHAIDLGDGIQTPGPFHMASFLSHYEFPDRMDGMRVLDVGASNGYFSFEFERRGAEEVVALDLPTWGSHDWTPRYRESYAAKEQAERDYIDREAMRAGFDLVKEALGSRRVRKVEMAIYDIAPETLGRFDFVFSGSMLMHVRDPILGIQRLRSIAKDTARLVISISTTMPDVNEPLARFCGEWDQCNWWQMNPRCLKDALSCCDLEVLGEGTLFHLTDRSGQFDDLTFVARARPMGRHKSRGSA